MRLGIVEMMPGDFRTWTKEHTRAVRDLGFTGIVDTVVDADVEAAARAAGLA